MNDKERAYFNELVTTKMNEVIDELGLSSPACPKQPEPQAGDVWKVGIDYAFFLRQHPDNKLTYVWDSGANGAYTREDFLEGHPTAVRIFSLSEHLKNKETEGV